MLKERSEFFFRKRVLKHDEYYTSDTDKRRGQNAFVLETLCKNGLINSEERTGSIRKETFLKYFGGPILFILINLSIIFHLAIH